MRSSKRRLSSERGFALITAILACMILFALAMLIINLSTGDLQVSARNVGEKKAMIAAETGIHQVMRNFNKNNPTASAAANVPVDATNDPASVYTITAPTQRMKPDGNPAWVPESGNSVCPKRLIYQASVTGQNTAYNTTMTVDIGIGALQCGED